jgi:hypothetical protein
MIRKSTWLLIALSVFPALPVNAKQLPPVTNSLTPIARSTKQVRSIIKLEQSYDSSVRIIEKRLVRWRDMLNTQPEQSWPNLQKLKIQSDQGIHTQGLGTKFEGFVQENPRIGADLNRRIRTSDAADVALQSDDWVYYAKISPANSGDKPEGVISSAIYNVYTGEFIAEIVVPDSSSINQLPPISHIWTASSFGQIAPKAAFVKWYDLAKTQPENCQERVQTLKFNCDDWIYHMYVYTLPNFAEQPNGIMTHQVYNAYTGQFAGVLCN